MEMWKDIKDYEGYYQISNLGRVKSINFNNTKQEKLMALTTTWDGYKKLRLSKMGKAKAYLSHRLVAVQFISNFENKPFVNHINGIKSDNRIENLEWCTQSENCIHSMKVLGNISGATGKTGYLNKNSKEVHQYTTNGDFIGKYGSQKEAERKTGIGQGLISRCVRGVINQTNGYIFKRINREICTA